VTKTSVAACGAALAVAGLLGAGLTGCSAKVETSTRTAVSAGDLQKQITDQLTEAGNAPQSVTCTGELVAEVGQSTMCDAVFSESNSVQAKVTVTGVQDSSVSFELSPSLTKEQLEKAVSALDGVQVATCDSGLDGAVGASAKCEVTSDGVTGKTVAEVDGIDGLQINLDIVPVVPKEKIQEVFLQKLNADGTAAETVECADDAMAKPGAFVECVAVTGDQKTGYEVTVTTVDGDNVDVEYKDAP
jgi:hypothetical protein